MPLTQQQIDGIIAVLEPYMFGSSAELRLLENHVDEEAHLHPAYIELLVVSEKVSLLENLTRWKSKIIKIMAELTGENNIELTFSTTQDIEQDEFLKNMFPISTILYTWK